MQIMPYKMSHDVADPVCYTVEADGQKVSMATDLGVYDDDIVDHLEDSDVLLIEANHDISMLEAGTLSVSAQASYFGRMGTFVQ